MSEVNKPDNTLNIVSIVLSGFSMFMIGFGVIFAIAAFVTAILARKERKSDLSLVAITLSIIVLVLNIIMIMGAVFIFTQLAHSYDRHKLLDKNWAPLPEERTLKR